jgi:hypothetical protein
LPRRQCFFEQKIAAAEFTAAYEQAKMRLGVVTRGRKRPLGAALGDHRLEPLKVNAVRRLLAGLAFARGAQKRRG